MDYVAHRAPPSMGFSEQDCHARLQRILQTQGFSLSLLCLMAGGFFTTSATWEALKRQQGLLNSDAFGVDFRLGKEVLGGEWVWQPGGKHETQTEVRAGWWICGLRETGVPGTPGVGKLGGNGAGGVRRDL